MYEKNSSLENEMKKNKIQLTLENVDEKNMYYKKHALDDVDEKKTCIIKNIALDDVDEKKHVLKKHCT